MENEEVSGNTHHGSFSFGIWSNKEIVRGTIAGLLCALVEIQSEDYTDLFLHIDATSSNSDYTVEFCIKGITNRSEMEISKWFFTFLCEKKKFNTFHVQRFMRSGEMFLELFQCQMRADLKLVEVLEEGNAVPTSQFDKPVDLFTDVIFCIENDEIHCDRKFMAYISPVFKSMLFADSSEAKKDRIELHEVNAEDFKNMLHLVYPNNRPITDETVAGILKIASMFKIQCAIDKCESFLSNSINQSFPKVMYLADTFALPLLLEKCIGIAQNHAKTAELVCSEYYSQLSLETTNKILKDLYPGRQSKAITNEFEPL